MKLHQRHAARYLVAAALAGCSTQPLLHDQRGTATKTASLNLIQQSYADNDVQTALNAYMQRFYTAGGSVSASFWEGAVVREMLCVANQKYLGKYRQQITDSYYAFENGINANVNGNAHTWLGNNFWTDDEFWHINAAISSYEQTGDQHMLDQAKWHANYFLATEVRQDGGMWHDWHARDYADMFTTGGAILATARLAKYDQTGVVTGTLTNQDGTPSGQVKKWTYQQWSQFMYKWAKGGQQANGAVQNGGTGSVHGNLYTAVTGLFIGDGVYLYQLTQDPQYLKDATLAASYVPNGSFVGNPDQLLQYEVNVSSDGTNHPYNPGSAGDEAIYKGILAWNMVRLYQQTQDGQFLGWLQSNAQHVWDGRNQQNDLLSGDWTQVNNPNANSDGGASSTGVMLMTYLSLVKPSGTAPAQPSPVTGGITGGDTVTSSPYFKALTSNSGAYALKMQDDGNLVEYTGTTPLWTSKTYLVGSGPYQAVMQADGNFVVYQQDGQINQANLGIWDSRTYGKGSAPYRLTLQNDGNIVIFDSTNTSIYGTGAVKASASASPGASLDQVTSTSFISSLTSQNGAYTLKMQSDGNLVEYAGTKAVWDTATYGVGTGPYRATMQEDGNLVIYQGSGAAIWSSKTYQKGTGPYHLTVQNDGNVVLYDANGTATFATGTH